MKTKLNSKIKRVVARFKKSSSKELSKIFLIIYLFSLFAGLVLTLSNTFIHSLVTCFSLFGTRFCTPTGIFIILFVNLPGYFVIGNILSFFPKIPWIISFILIAFFSGSFYFLLGILIDKVRKNKFTTGSFTKLLIYSLFVILIIIFISLIK